MRITVKQVASVLNTSELTVRYGIESGTLPIGTYVKIPDSKRTIFLIDSNQLAEYLKISEGILIEEFKDDIIVKVEESVDKNIEIELINTERTTVVNSSGFEVSFKNPFPLLLKAKEEELYKSIKSEKQSYGSLFNCSKMATEIFKEKHNITGKSVSRQTKYITSIDDVNEIFDIFKSLFNVYQYHLSNQKGEQK